MCIQSNNFMAGFEWYATPKKSPTKRVPLCNLANVQLRFLCPSDLEEVKALCQDWFPIDYPWHWYEDITSNPHFYSLAAVYNGVIIGLIVAEIQQYYDETILASSFGEDAVVGYILSLGVSEKHRRNGIASLLLDNLICHLTIEEHARCKALFLHVLTTNKAAIHFYQRHHFRLHSFLPYYYFIEGTSKDGFIYVLYINGGHPPWGLHDYIKHICCSLRWTNVLSTMSWVWSKVSAAVHWAWTGLRVPCLPCPSSASVGCSTCSRPDDFDLLKNEIRVRKKLELHRAFHSLPPIGTRRMRGEETCCSHPPFIFRVRVCVADTAVHETLKFAVKHDEYLRCAAVKLPKPDWPPLSKPWTSV